MVEYVYSAWGNHAVEVLDSTCAELSQLNPFRYRGYYYDTETGLYFLKTRYYDPEVGRFITIDDLSYLDPETINGLNLYAYCGNNPVMNVDSYGTKWWHWLLGALVVVGAAVLTVVTAGGFGVVGSVIGSIIIEGLKTGWNISDTFWTKSIWTNVLPSALLNGATNILSLGLGKMMGVGISATSFLGQFADWLAFGGFTFSAAMFIEFPMFAIGLIPIAIMRAKTKEGNLGTT